MQNFVLAVPPIVLSIFAVVRTAFSLVKWPSVLTVLTIFLFKKKHTRRRRGKSFLGSWDRWLGQPKESGTHNLRPSVMRAIKKGFVYVATQC
jgi:hypothetical protein